MPARPVTLLLATLSLFGAVTVGGASAAAADQAPAGEVLRVASVAFAPCPSPSAADLAAKARSEAKVAKAAARRAQAAARSGQPAKRMAARSAGLAAQKAVLAQRAAARAAKAAGRAGCTSAK